MKHTTSISFSLAVAAASALAPVTLAGYYADITGLGGSQSYAFIGLHGATNGDDEFVWDSSTSGSPLAGDMGLFSAYGGAVMSGFNAQGIGLYVTELSGNSTPEFSMQQGFQSSEEFVMTWNSTYLPNGGGFLRLAKFDDYTAANGGNQIGAMYDFANTPGPITLGATSGLEYYKIFYASYGSGPLQQPGLWMMNVSFVATPAPGALALLGVAGIAGSRRRR